MNRKKTGRPTLHSRKWRRISPCPFCGARKPRIECQARPFGAARLTHWITECRKCPNVVLFVTLDGDIKTAIREWNQLANGQWRKECIGITA